jgi:hypothetical protein
MIKPEVCLNNQSADVIYTIFANWGSEDYEEITTKLDSV